MGTALHSLVADVSCRKAWEHEHGCLAGDGAARGLQGTYARHGRGVVLQRAIDEHFGAGFLHDLGGFANQVCIRALAAVHGAVAEECHTAREAEGLRGVVALLGDTGEFLGGRVQVNGAVAVNVSLVRHAHKEHGAHGLYARSALDHLECRTKRVGGGVNGARNEAIDFAHLEHHGAKHHVVGERCAGLVFGHALRLAEFHKRRHVLFGKFCRRFNNFDVGGEGDTLFLGDGEDFVLLANEHRHGDFAVDYELCGLHGTRFGTFGEYDALLGLGGLQEEACAEHGLRGLAFGGFCGEVLGDALAAGEQTVGAEQVCVFAVGINLGVEGCCQGVVVLLGNHVAHALGAFNYDGVDGIKVLREEVGGNLFHKHCGIVGLEFLGGFGSVHAGLVGGGDQAGGGYGVHDFLDFCFHVGGGD